MSEALSDISRGPWFLLVAATNELMARALRHQSRQRLELVANFTGRQHAVMRQVYLLTMKCPEGIPLKQLAAALNLSPGTVSEAVEALVRKQMLARTTCPTDRRAIQIRLAPLGATIIHTGAELIAQETKAFLDSLSKEEAEQFVATLTKFHHYMEQKKE